MQPTKEAAKFIFKTGLNAWFKDLNGSSATGGSLKQKITTHLVAASKDGLQAALNDSEVKNEGREAVRHQLHEGVETIKDEFKSITDTVHGWVNKDEDKRSNYKKARALLGNNNDDAWYVRLGKGIGARVIAFTLPILAFIGANVAMRFTQKKDEEQHYRENLKGIMSGLLGMSTVPKSA